MRKYFGASRFRSRRNGSAREERVGKRLLPFSFKITGAGFLFLCTLALLWLAAINSGNNLLFAVVAILLGTVVVSGVVSRSSLRQISLSMQLPENVFVGERISIKITLRNLKRFFPSFSVHVQAPDLGVKRNWKIFSHIFRTEKGNGFSLSHDSDGNMFRQEAYFPILKAGDAVSELTFQSFPHRGKYHLRGFWVSTRFPFGLFDWGQFVGAKGEILVYPLLREISSYLHLLPFMPGHIESLHVGHGENLFSIRKYHDTDNARIIDWKATAKTGVVMAREFAREEDNEICLILDTRVAANAADDIHDQFEKAVSLAASITAHFIREGAVMEFLAPLEYVPRGTGRDHLYRILRSLAVVQYEVVESGGENLAWDSRTFPCIQEPTSLHRILSDKVFKIIISTQPRKSFPSSLWRSSHVIFWDEI